ncbi:MAG: hypothetical protein ACEPOV_08550 [Hyphomicrobiales bacterium]
MKTRKLKFKKQTIAKLELMDNIKGGLTTYFDSCHFCLVTDLNNCITEAVTCGGNKCVSDYPVCNSLGNICVSDDIVCG